MTFEAYRPLARRTQNKKLTETETLLHALCGLAAETAEFMAEIRHGRTGPAILEAGDVCWMAAELCDVSSIDLTTEDILTSHGSMELNIAVGAIHGVYQKHLQGHELAEGMIHDQLAKVLSGMLFALYYKMDWGTPIYSQKERLMRTLDIITEKNIKKLQERYPDGFDEQRSVNR